VPTGPAGGSIHKRTSRMGQTLPKPGFRNGPVVVKPWRCRTLPFTSPQHLAVRYLLPPILSAEAAYMMRSDRGMASPIWRARDFVVNDVYCQAYDGR
jgi:hypothetical protein